MENFDVFISYQWDVKEKIKSLYTDLKNVRNLRVWIDEQELGAANLADEIAKGIID